MNEWQNSLPKGKRNAYMAILGVILFTIPCYCLGIAALVAAPPVRLATPTPLEISPGPIVATSQIIPSPTQTATPLPDTPTEPLEPTPTQIFPTVAPTETPVPEPNRATAVPIGNIRGKVTEISGNSFTLETIHRGEITVLTVDTTKYRSPRGRAVSFDDIEVGKSVIVRGKLVGTQEKIVQAELVAIP